MPGTSSNAQIASAFDPRDGTAKDRKTAPPKVNFGASARVATGMSISLNSQFV
jgi:hypothetical protein